MSDLHEPGTGAYAELVKLYRREGVLTAAAVVAEAADHTSPLHAYFEWNDEAAAVQHRLEQARQLIKSYRVRIVSEEEQTSQVRAWISEPDRGGYSMVVDVVRDEERREAEMARIRAQAALIATKADEFEEFAVLAAAIRESLAA